MTQGWQLSDASLSGTGRLPAACISGVVSSYCLLEREVGEIIMSPWEEIWVQAAASFFQLWEKRCLFSILPQRGMG